MLRARQKFGKYIIERKLGEGGFARVYQARDTIEGVRVALKIPYPHLVTKETIEYFRREVRVAARLEHANILPLKYADYIDGHLVIVTAMAKMTLDERLQRRLALDTALDFTEQMLSAVAYAHGHRIIHCDIKPDNFLLFPDNRIRLTDFGTARVAQKTLRGSGTGTVGYIAPEQAMGQPSFRSDVFSLGIVIFRMFSGQLPDWPYKWPLPGHERLQARLHPQFVGIIRRALEIEARKRFADAQQMLAAYRRVRSKAKRPRHTKPRHPRPRTKSGWQAVKRREFIQQFGKPLEARYACASCNGPLSEYMQACPWCGKTRRRHQGDTSFPAQCPRCYRGIKLDWSYCPWCYGVGFDPLSSREFSDRRYAARCDNPRCTRKVLMPFMKYCPWCRRRVRRKWKIAGETGRCSSCGWGTVSSFWDYCPWCGKGQSGT